MKTLEELPLGLPEMETIGEALIARGYGYIPFTPPRGLIETVMQGWNEFLALPPEERLEWHFPFFKDTDNGYVPRKPGQSCPGCSGCHACAVQKEKTFDHKDFFHFRPSLVTFLDDMKVDHSRQMPWLHQVNELYEFCRNAFHKALLELDSYYPFDFAKRFSSFPANARHVLRLLSYKDLMRPGKVLAVKHIDRNFGTIQIHESHPGLVLDLPEGESQYVPRRGQSLLFTGGKAHKITDGSLQGIRHAVVVPKDVVSDNIQKVRQSMVFFAHV